MTAENSSDPTKGQDSSTHVHSTGPSQAPTGLARTRHRRHWVGDLVRLMVGLTACRGTSHGPGVLSGAYSATGAARTVAELGPAWVRW